MLTEILQTAAEGGDGSQWRLSSAVFKLCDDTEAALPSSLLRGARDKGGINDWAGRGRSMRGEAVGLNGRRSRRAAKRPTVWVMGEQRRNRRGNKEKTEKETEPKALNADRIHILSAHSLSPTVFTMHLLRMKPDSKTQL